MLLRFVGSESTASDFDALQSYLETHGCPSRAFHSDKHSIFGVNKPDAKGGQALLAGDTLEIVSDRFSVSKETLRSQLKSVFLETGTSRQTELLGLGLRGLAVFGR